MWELDDEQSWAPKNWCFWTVVWRRLLRVPWTTRRSNQSILKKISPGCSLEGLMLKLKLQYFSHLKWRADSFEKTLMFRKIEGRKRRGQQRRDGKNTQRKYGFSSGYVWMESWTIKKADCQRIDALNCGVGEDSWESLGLQGNPTSPF